MSAELTEEQIKDLNHKKAAHDYFATAIQILTTRVQFFYEEFEGTHSTVGFLKNMLAQIKKDIETLEPIKKEEPKQAYEMDLTHLSSGAQNVQST